MKEKPSLRIMGCDDDDFIHAMLYSMLQRMDGTRWPYHSCKTLEIGLEDIASFKPDIILYDLHFTTHEDATLSTAVNLIQEFSNHAAVIVMTGYANPEVHEQCVRNGAVDFLDKNTLFNLGAKCPHCKHEINLLELSGLLLRKTCYNAALQWNVKHAQSRTTT